MKCLICKSGMLNDGLETYFATLKTGYVIIENVPCKKCEQCGEILFSASVIEKIEKLLDNVEKISSKIFIFDYNSAA
ncbi:MAG: type II toxin-antitoxin system MqsA family antitoxin [Selenomonadaceae bacterium]|nr:type II toxin-antitoxin system MqsA family antitoxin [Selenomonadaceae bacterium]